MQRRTLIKRIGAGLLGSLIHPSSVFGENACLESTLWMEILEEARWSPSPHNIQPWKVKIIDADHAELYCETSRLIPVSDEQNKFMLITFGVFLENLSLVAAHAGFGLIFTGSGAFLDQYGPPYQIVGSMTLVKAPLSPDYSKDLIRKRRTSRLHYHGKAIDPETLQELGKIAASSDHQFQSSSTKKLVNEVLKLDTEILLRDTNDALRRNELESWLRYSEPEAENKRDGLWSRCMGFPGNLMKNFFHHHGHYERGLFKAIMEQYYLRSMHGTRTVMWIRGVVDSPEACIRAGRLLAHLWLELTSRNIYMHPFGSVITNKAAKAHLQELCGGSGPDFWFLARLGYSEEPPRSFRLRADEIILKPDKS